MKQLAFVVSALKGARFHIIRAGERERGSSVLAGIDGSLNILDPKGMCEVCGVRTAVSPGPHDRTEKPRKCAPCRAGVI